MTFRRSPHERVLALVHLSGIHVHAAIKQQLHFFGTARAGGNHERGFAVPARHLRVRATFQELLDQRYVAVGQRQRERRFPVFGGRIDVGSGCDQLFSRFLQIEERRPGERGGTVGQRCVHVGMLRHQSVEGFDVSPLKRVD